MHDDYKGLMDRLLELPACALLPTGRTGSDLLQSFLDCHPEVLTFNGRLLFHAFWESSLCAAAGDFAAEDLIDEFIGKHIYTLKSRYDIWERKHQLGEQHDQVIDIDLHRFRTEALNLLDGRQVTSQTALVAIYAAYALCLGQDLEQKKLFFHHPHAFSEMPSYLKDFPDSKIICMTRDPRASFVSGIEHHRNFNNAVDTDTGGHLFFTINRILNDASPLERYSNEYRVVRLEDLGRRDILLTLCKWLNISFDECLTKSTWGGLMWQGDKLSKVNREPGFSAELLDNQWEKRLSFTDKYVLNYIMNPRLKQYGYSRHRAELLGTLIVPLLILLPLSYEFRFFSPGYMRDRIRKGQSKTIARNCLDYVRRVRVFFRFYLRTTFKMKFNQPILSPDNAASDGAPVREG